MRQRIIRIPEPLYLMGKEKQKEYKKKNAPRIPALWECVFKESAKKKKDDWGLRF